MSLIKTTVVACLAILVIVTAVLLLTKPTVAEYSGPSCACTITQLDFYGNPWTSQVQHIRVQLTGRLSDEVCNNRCNAMFSAASENKIVTGVVA